VLKTTAFPRVAVTHPCSGSRKNASRIVSTLVVRAPQPDDGETDGAELEPGVDECAGRLGSGGEFVHEAAISVAATNRPARRIIGGTGNSSRPGDFSARCGVPLAVESAGSLRPGHIGKPARNELIRPRRGIQAINGPDTCFLNIVGSQRPKNARNPAAPSHSLFVYERPQVRVGWLDELVAAPQAEAEALSPAPGQPAAAPPEAVPGGLDRQSG
jgi:hypothetical protein